MCLLHILIVCILVAIANANSTHVFSFHNTTLFTSRSSGNLAAITSKEFPILDGLSIRRLILEPSAVREPHWHTNAHELAYCLRGSALVTIFGNDNEHSTFTVSQGEMFFVPSGYLHHVENINPSKNEISTAEFIVAFTHDLPEDFQLSSAFAAMTNAVLGNTFQLPASAWKDVVKRGEETVIGKKDTVTSIDDQKMPHSEDKYKFNIEKMLPSLNIPEGSIKKASKKFWPILEDISMFSFRMSTSGMREPHWHPDTAEMGYVVSGQARMTVLSPNGDDKLDTYTLKPGDVYFIPRAYPNHIENIGDDEVHFLCFWDQSTPGDIGYTGVFSAYSREVLAATLQCSSSQLPKIPSYPKNLLIVKRINHVDP